MNSEEDIDLCEKILKKPEEAELSLIPKKSELNKFSQRMHNKSSEIVTEKVLLVYFLDQGN
jgi:hypothetical protein